MKTCIIYHRVDWDGYTAAAVALRAFPDADLIGWNYRDPLPIVALYDCVILVDLTIYLVRPDNTRDFSWMKYNQSKLIWIDHHPIIHEVPGKYAGIQKEGIGACWLTWRYFHNNYGVSCNTDHIKLAATFDVFRKDGRFCSWEDAWAYQLFLNTSGPGYIAGTGDRSKELVELASTLLVAGPDVIEKHIQFGYTKERERAEKEAEIFANHAVHARIGKHLGWLIESEEQPAMVVKSHSDFDIGEFFILYSKNKKDINGNYYVSIRTSANSDFSSKAFAEAHGGGGHEKAAGCVLSEEEIKDLIK